MVMEHCLVIGQPYIQLAFDRDCPYVNVGYRDKKGLCPKSNLSLYRKSFKSAQRLSHEDVKDRVSFQFIKCVKVFKEFARSYYFIHLYLNELQCLEIYETDGYNTGPLDK